MAMKTGRFWLSLPRPYVNHEPMLGRICRASPQFMSNSDGSWFGTSAYIERITHNSSACCATLEKISLTSNPHCPYFWNLNGDGYAAPVLRSVRGLGIGKSLPAYSCSLGLGSNVST